MSAGVPRDPAVAPEPLATDRSVADMARHVAELRARLESRLVQGRSASPDERGALRSEIAHAIRASDASVEVWRAVADAARALPELWKQLSTAESPNASTHAVSTPTPDRATTVRSDHLGASTFVAKGWTAYAAGEFAAAESAFERALALAPDEPETIAMLAWARAALGRADDALLAAQRVLVARALGPAVSLARVAVGRVCLEKGIEGEAIEHLARVVRDNDDRRATLYATLYLGVAYQRRGMYDDAVAFLRRALALGPNLTEARYALACCLWRSDACDDARAEWRRGAVSAFSPWSRSCAERLAEFDAGAEVRA